MMPLSVYVSFHTENLVSLYQIQCSVNGDTVSTLALILRIWFLLPNTVQCKWETYCGIGATWILRQLLISEDFYLEKQKILKSF